MAADIGKVFEKEIRKVFVILKDQRHVAWHRLLDTGAAGNTVGEQPSDFLLGLPPGCTNLLDNQRLMLLEVKASEKHHTLGKAMMTPSQRGAIARYRQMLNIPYVILFWDTQDGVIQMWDGAAILGEKNINKRDMLAQWSDCGVISKLRHEVVAKYLIEYFQIPAGAATLAAALR